MRKSAVWVAALWATVFSSASFAQQYLLNDVHTVTAADRPIAAEHSFDISVAGTYKITLADLGAQLTPAAPLQSVKMAITSGGKVVAGSTLSAAGTATFSATTGTYIIHVLGVPDSTKPGSGPIGLEVADAGGNTVASFNDTFAVPATATPSNQGVLDDSFSAPSSGNYQISLSDLQLPQALDSASLLVLEEGGPVVAALSVGGSSGASTNTTVALQSGLTYRAIAVGQAGSVVNAGLYGVVVAPAGGGQPAYGRSVPIGLVTSIAAPTLGASTYTVNVADLNFPAPLAQLGAVVTLNGQIAAQLNAAGTTTLSASAAKYQVYGFAAGGAMPGSYAITLKSSTDTAVNVARVTPDSAGTYSVYSFDTPAVAAGQTTLDLADFAVPATFQSLSCVAVQNGAPLAQPLSAAGSATLTAAAGPMSILVVAQAQGSGNTPGAGGLLGVDLVASGSSNPAFEITQGVGQLFSAQQISVTAAAKYGLNVADVGFPANLQALYVVLTRGAKPVVTVIGGAVNTQYVFDATPGKYFVNVVAQPTSADQAGTYALSVAAQPTVTLSASATHVASGGTVDLTWSSDGATACTASDGWSGQKGTSGKVTSPALTANTQFTLSCDGPGGTVAQSVSVTIDAPSSSGGGGGGGALTTGWLTLLGGLAAAILSRRQPRDRLPI